MNVGVKLFHQLALDAESNKLLLDAGYVEELLVKLSVKLGRPTPLNLQDVCVFRNGINVEMVGGPDAPFQDQDWVAIFPRKERQPIQDADELE